MRSSWVCWRLLLTWALLLGQPVSGEEEGYQVPPSEGSEELVEASRSEEALELEQDEEPEEELEPEDGAELEDPLEPELTEEERLEREASWTREYVEEDMKLGYSPLGSFRRMAIDYLKGQDNDADYRHLEDSSLVVQKAIGSLFKFRMFVKKGNCTEDPRMNVEDYLDYYYMLRHHPAWDRESRETCEKLDCTFTVFANARTHREAVIDAICGPLVLAHDIIRQQPYDEDEEEGSASTFDYEDAGMPAPYSEEEDVPASYDRADEESVPPSYSDDADVPPSYSDDADVPPSYSEEEDVDHADPEF